MEICNSQDHRQTGVAGARAHYGALNNGIYIYQFSYSGIYIQCQAIGLQAMVAPGPGIDSIDSLLVN